MAGFGFAAAGGFGLAGAGAEFCAKATAMLNAIQPTGVGKTVGISFTLPPEIIDIINGVAGLNNLHSDKPATGGSSR